MNPTGLPSLLRSAFKKSLRWSWRRAGQSLAGGMVIGVLLLGLMPALLAEAAPSTVYNYKPPRAGFSWKQKLNPGFWFGNADDPEPPAYYLPDDPHRKSKWYYRNPLHNFTFYVIGIADKQFERKGWLADQNFAEPGGWNWAVCKYRLLRLPFLSYKNKHLQAYFGWRESGNFGMKFNLFHSRVQGY